MERIERTMRISPQKKLKLASIMIVACGILFAPIPVHSQADFSALYEYIAPPVVLVSTPGSGTGSGFIVQVTAADGEVRTGIVTACHVVYQAPRPFGDEDATPIVDVTFDAWKPDLTIRAGVVECSAANDAALLLPVDENDDVVSMRNFFEGLAVEQEDPSLRGFPRLYFADSDEVNPLDPVFVIGHPGPFRELNSVQGRVSGTLTVPHVEADSGSVDRIAALLIYDGRPDRSIPLENVLSVQTLPGLGLEELAELAEDIFAAGHNLLLLSDTQPTGFRATAWDALDVVDGILRVQERALDFEASLFGDSLNIGPRIESFGEVSLLREFFRMDLPIVGGHSGAPVMNVSGQVIGMVEWGLDSPGANFASMSNNTVNALFGE